MRERARDMDDGVLDGTNIRHTHIHDATHTHCSIHDATHTHYSIHNATHTLRYQTHHQLPHTTQLLRLPGYTKIRHIMPTCKYNEIGSF